jgi:quercetin dioxygenase-like cupin family protein
MTGTLFPSRLTTRDTMERQQPSTLRAYKRSPALDNSRWYKGLLFSRMAGPADNNGAFDFVIAKVRRGTEPPPHVHSREDEFFYLPSGEITFYVDGKVFSVKAGECVFLTRRIPHAWLIRSEEANMIAVITPAGFTDALEKMSTPAERMDVPSDVDTVTYANADLKTREMNEVWGSVLLRCKH